MWKVFFWILKITVRIVAYALGIFLISDGFQLNLIGQHNGIYYFDNLWISLLIGGFLLSVPYIIEKIIEHVDKQVGKEIRAFWAKPYRLPRLIDVFVLYGTLPFVGWLIAFYIGEKYNLLIIEYLLLPILFLFIEIKFRKYFYSFWKKITNKATLWKWIGRIILYIAILLILLALYLHPHHPYGTHVHYPLQTVGPEKPESYYIDQWKNMLEENGPPATVLFTQEVEFGWYAFFEQIVEDQRRISIAGVHRQLRGTASEEDFIRTFEGDVTISNVIHVPNAGVNNDMAYFVFDKSGICPNDSRIEHFPNGYKSELNEVRIINMPQANTWYRPLDYQWGARIGFTLDVLARECNSGDYFIEKWSYYDGKFRTLKNREPAYSDGSLREEGIDQRLYYKEIIDNTLGK